MLPVGIVVLLALLLVAILWSSIVPFSDAPSGRWSTQAYTGLWHFWSLRRSSVVARLRGSCLLSPSWRGHLWMWITSWLPGHAASGQRPIWKSDHQRTAWPLRSWSAGVDTCSLEASLLPGSYSLGLRRTFCAMRLSVRCRSCGRWLTAG